MDQHFWLSRWAHNEIGFHQSRVNPYLERHLADFGLEPGSRVLVPLCGKSLDLLWLAGQGYPVLGVELAAKAVEDFFAEHGLEPEIVECEAFDCYRVGSIEIWCGDFFALTAEDVAQCRLWYDRAAIIALPAEMRRRYAEHLSNILPADCRGLMVTLEYDQSRKDGPPFAVTTDELWQLFGAGWDIRTLQREEVIGESPRFAEAGLTSLVETAYGLVRRS